MTGDPGENQKGYLHLATEMLSPQLPIAALLEDTSGTEELVPSKHSGSQHSSPPAERCPESPFPTGAGWPPPLHEWLWLTRAPTFLFQTMMCVLRLPVNSSAQITLAACCVHVTQDTAMTGRDTGSGRSPTAWVRWQYTSLPSS